MAYSGYLIKVGNYTIPLSVMRADTYKAVRTIIDLDAYRDANGKLHRNALDNEPSKVEFETLPLMTNSQMSDLLGNIQRQYTVPKERKANVTFYVPETNSYVTQEMYMPDINFQIYYADSEKIQYQPTRLAFIGY